MKKVTSSFILIVSMCLLLSATGCIGTWVGSGPAIDGASTLETREMDFSDFNMVKAGYAFQVDITRANSFSVSITMNDNLFDYLVIEQSGDTLNIGLEPNHSYRNIQHRATITMPELRGLELSGASKGDVSGFSSTDSLQLEASGASFLDINDVKAGDTEFTISGASKAYGSIEIANGTFRISGASNVSLEGTAGDVVLEVSGASSVNLGDFTVADASVGASGASSVTVSASGTLDVDVSGASRLYYTGSGTLGSVAVSGASTIKQR